MPEQELTPRIDEENATFNTIMAQIPELFNLQLHPEFQQRLAVLTAKFSYKDAKEKHINIETLPNSYVIGINQTGAKDGSTPKTAKKYLEANGGINITGYNLKHRFVLFNPDDVDKSGANRIIKEAIVGGYFGDITIGRFVIAVPSLGVEASSPYLDVAFEATGALQKMGDKNVVMSRFIAYFIDCEGTVWANTNFTISDEVNLVAISDL